MLNKDHERVHISKKQNVKVLFILRLSTSDVFKILKFALHSTQRKVIFNKINNNKLESNIKELYGYLSIEHYDILHCRDIGPVN